MGPQNMMSLQKSVKINPFNRSHCTSLSDDFQTVLELPNFCINLKEVEKDWIGLRKRTKTLYLKKKAEMETYPQEVQGKYKHYNHVTKKHNNQDTANTL
jgi:hypothetical protein